MRKIITLSVFVFIKSFFVQGQAYYQKVFATDYLIHDQFVDAAPSYNSPNNLVLTGSIRLNAGSHGVIMEVDTFGNIVWQYDLGNISPKKIDRTLDGGFYIAGQIGTGNRLHLIKTDGQGIKQWHKSYGNSTKDEMKYMQTTTDGGTILVGRNNENAYVVKTDNNGDTLWTKSIAGFTGSGVFYSSFTHVLEITSDGSFLIGGQYLEDFITLRTWIMKISSSGTIDWHKTYPFLGQKWVESIKEISTGYKIICAGYYSVAMMKIDTLGKVDWARNVGGTISLLATQTVSDGELWFGHTGDSGMMAKVTNDSIISWEHYTWGENAKTTYFYGAHEFNNAYVAYGASEVFSTLNSRRDAYLNRMDLNGNSLCAAGFDSKLGPFTAPSNDTTDIPPYTISSGTIVNSISIDTFVGEGIQDIYGCCNWAPVADFIYSIDGYKVTFTNTSMKAGPVSYRWEFGDLDGSVAENPVHTYSDTGTFEVCFWVTETCNDSMICQNITITGIADSCPSPEAGFDIMQTGNSISIINTTMSGDSWYWDFGDFQNSTQQNPIHFYQYGGTYKLCLIAINSCGKDTACMNISISNNVSVSELKNIYDIKIFPVPATDQVIIDYSLPQTATVKIELMDLIGQSILIENIGETAAGTNRYYLNKKMIPGLYLLTINIAEDIYTIKVIYK